MNVSCALNILFKTSSQKQNYLNLTYDNTNSTTVKTITVESFEGANVVQIQIIQLISLVICAYARFSHLKSMLICYHPL